jgi:hypothetical protein
MSLSEFKQSLSEQYQGEVIGEAFFCRLLERFTDPEQRYKLGSFLQIETETKARLRPAMLELGVDLVELDASREQGEAFAQSLEGLDWRQTMSQLARLVVPFLERYRELAAIAPTEYRELAQSMVVHEASIQRAAQLEAAGEANSMRDVVAQLRFPLPNAR